ncbi:MAG: 50S ribosomal protein L44e [Candidatus Aenigmatarchaeota archaeon]
MKIPKVQKKYCPKCDKHTEHELRKEKVGARNRSILSKGERRRVRRSKGHGNSSYSKGVAGEKPTRKVDLRYKCRECGREQIIGKGFRVKRLEIER